MVISTSYSDDKTNICTHLGRSKQIKHKPTFRRRRRGRRGRSRGGRSRRWVSRSNRSSRGNRTRGNRRGRRQDRISRIGSEESRLRGSRRMGRKGGEKWCPLRMCRRRCGNRRGRCQCRID